MLSARPTVRLTIAPATRDLLARIESFLTGLGIRAYVTGGLIRDGLLGRETADIDIALEADALLVADSLATALGVRAIPLDEANGVVRIVQDNPQATLSGEHREIDLTTAQDGIEKDLSRRDFTINAMAFPLSMFGQEQRPPHQEELLAQLIDPCHGLTDLRRRLIRVTGETVFAADAVRMLRAVRLAAELGFAIEAETEALLRRDCSLIAGTAGERVREELLRLLAQDNQYLRRLDAMGLLTAIIPELIPLKGAIQPPEHYWDVFEHSLETAAAVDFLLRQGKLDYAGNDVLETAPWTETLAGHFAVSVSPSSTRRSLLKLAALLHDVAKPQTKAIAENGRMRFLGHAPAGAEITAIILQKLRFSGKEIKLTAAMVEHHLRPTQMSQGGMPSRRAIYRYFRDTADAGIDTLFLSLADHLAARGPRLEIGDWQEHAEMIDYILVQHAGEEGLKAPPKLIDGHDLMNTFGLPPGPRLGELLEAVREAQAAGEISTRDEALSFVRRQLSPPSG